MDNDAISGNEPPADGVHIAVRIRRDFTIADAGRLLASARAAYIELNPSPAQVQREGSMGRRKSSSERPSRMPST
jgi:hypothetical protein